MVERLQEELTRGGVDEITFTADIRPTGRTTLGLIRDCPSVETAPGRHGLGVLVLAEGALPGPWRRLPDPVPSAVAAPSVDLELLDRTLRERLPDSIGVTDEEIAAAETRLGITLPDELKVLYRVTGARQGERREDRPARRRADAAVGWELSALDDLRIVEATARHPRWGSGARTAVVTRPDDPVQNLAGSPGWLVFSGHGDELAVDLTPGPRGYTGQIIRIDHEQSIGAELRADSLTDLVLSRTKQERRGRREEGPPVVARIGDGSPQTVEAAADRALEVLTVGAGDHAPISLAPVTALPRLRTLIAHPGTLAEPLEVTRLGGLEFLELGTQDWRLLLDAGAVPRTLSAASVAAQEDEDLQRVVDVANEILVLRGRPRMVRTVLEGDLGLLS
ncbi:SMI1/KNR4 family protein [Streptomyces sp. NPDC056749]|uniref:SMI1/KNR4 family protein n=1 Tax=Streptomyces sp. NPDC056749 TaxID=3345936 RepID=UPI003692477D